MPAPTELEVLLGDSPTNLQVWFESKNLLPGEAAVAEFLVAQTWATANKLVDATRPLIQYFAEVVGGLLPETEQAVTEFLRLDLGRVFVSGWMGARSSREADVAVGLAAHLRTWMLELQSSGRIDAEVPVSEIVPRRVQDSISVRSEAIGYVMSAVLDRQAEEARDSGYLLKLARIRTALGLRAAELARLLNVSREGLRQWEQGAPIAPERWTTIDRLYVVVERLLEYIKPESLPVVLRRPAPALNNATPLEWLLAQRSDELLGVYERLFSFSSTR